MSTVSKYLSVLKAAGLVSDDNRGLQVFYTLRAPCILKFLSCVERVVRERAEAQLAAMR